MVLICFLQKIEKGDGYEQNEERLDRSVGCGNLFDHFGNSTTVRLLERQGLMAQTQGHRE
ncbi:MAG TPA: hypothetical protein DCS43_11200 [Verrucomicrobia bacterium]|nr:hypothetical protein [Verrucomicrobiota bacterium]